MSEADLKKVLGPALLRGSVPKEKPSVEEDEFSPGEIAAAEVALGALERKDVRGFLKAYKSLRDQNGG